MSITIKFLLPNQQHLTTKQFDKSISISQVFEDIHYQYDFFDEENFHLEWSIYSSAANLYLGYETITFQEIFPNLQEDTFIFLDSMITGLKLSHWFQKASKNDSEIENFNDEQIHQLKNTVLEGCVLLTCEDYHKSIEQYLSALEINLLNEESILGIGILYLIQFMVDVQQIQIVRNLLYKFMIY